MLPNVSIPIEPPRLFLTLALTHAHPYSLTDDSPKSLWIAYRGKVYDFTGFEHDHPGGDDLILRYAGKDMGEAMADPTEHVHSRSAYEMMDDFQIGMLGGSEKIVSEGEESCWWLSGRVLEY
jgi:cytochrome b involved in lipid metabolism